MHYLTLGLTNARLSVATSLAEMRAATAVAQNRHTRLVLVVGGSGDHASELIAEFGRDLKVRVAHVSLVVSEKLLNLPAKHRPVAAADATADLIRTTDPKGLSLLAHLQLLFLPELHLDPLKLLADSARSQVVVAAWPGEWSESCLRYAAPSHPEFRAYASPDCLVVDATLSAKHRS